MTGNGLKEKRKQLGLNQDQLARVLDVSSSTVARWEQLKEEEIPGSRLLELAIEGLQAKLIAQGHKKPSWKSVGRKVLLNN